MKRCSRCNDDKPRDMFSLSKQTKDGLFRWCKACVSVYQKQKRSNWKSRSPEVAKQRYLKLGPDEKWLKNHLAYLRNREKHIERARRYRLANADKKRDCDKRWRERNRDHFLRSLVLLRDAKRGIPGRKCTRCSAAIAVESCHSWCRRCLADDQAQRRAKSGAPVRFKKAATGASPGRRRRERMLTNGGKGVTPAEWQAIKHDFGYACAYCEETGVRLEKDHVHSIARGGSDSPENIVPACRRCNATKGAGTVLDLAIRLSLRDAIKL